MKSRYTKWTFYECSLSLWAFTPSEFRYNRALEEKYWTYLKTRAPHRSNLALLTFYFQFQTQNMWVCGGFLLVFLMQESACCRNELLPISPSNSRKMHIYYCYVVFITQTFQIVSEKKDGTRGGIRLFQCPSLWWTGFWKFLHNIFFTLIDFFSVCSGLFFHEPCAVLC